MGKSSSAEIGTKYLVAWHVLLAKRVDAVLEMRAGDKTAWSGSVSASTTIVVNQPQLFGGDKDQGGLVGGLAFMMGEAGQLPQPYLTTTFGDHTVAWRGFTTLAWLGGEYGSNNPYPFKMSAKTFSCHGIWDEAPGWYPETAAIRFGVDFDYDSGTAWKYKYEPAGSTADYSSASYDDSSWPTGPGAFGNKGYGSGTPSIGTFLPYVDGGIIWIRSHVPYTGGDITAEVLHDTEPFLFWNGLDVPLTFLSGDPFNTSKSIATISASLQGISNVVALKVVDHEPDAITAGLRLYSSATSSGAMNPVHIIVHAHTHSEMARMPIETIDDANARAAADWYYAKGFGINVRQKVANESPADVIRRVERVAGLSFTRDMTTGLYRFYIANGEYDLESLPILTDDDIVSYKETPTIPDNAVNSVQVKYFDAERKETVSTPPLRALGLVSLYGEIQQTFDFPELPSGGLANLVAWREALGSVTPTRRFDLVAKPTGAASDINKGQYFRLQLPKRGIVDMVCILGEKDGGTLESGNLGLTVAQDVWSLPDTVYSDIEHGIDPRPSQTADAIVLQRAFEAPYFDVCQRLPRTELEALPEEVGYLIGIAVNPSNSVGFTMRVAPSGGAYTDVANGPYCPTAVVNEAADYMDTAFTLSGAKDLAQVAVGDAVLWGTEVCRVDAISDVGALTGGTVPLIPFNPGFEDDLTGWEADAAPRPVVSSTWAIITDPGRAHAGGKFLRWTGDSTPLSSGPLEEMKFYSTTHVDSSGADLFSTAIFARVSRPDTSGTGLVRARVGIQKYDFEDNELGNTMNGAVALYGSALDSGWTKISTFTEKTAGVAYFRVFAGAQGPAGSVVEFDTLTWNGSEPSAESPLVANPNAEVTITLGRGCADTVRVKHAAGERLWFYSGDAAYDSTEHVAGETVDVKLLTNTGSQQLAEADATAMSLTFDQRLTRPYPPGLLQLNGTDYPASISGDVPLTVTWAHRDRGLQADQLIDQTMGSVGPESTVRYALRFLDAADALLIEKLDISGTTADVVLNYTGDVTMQLYAISDLGESWQRHSHTFAYAPPTGTSASSITASTYTAAATVIDGGGA